MGANGSCEAEEAVEEAHHMKRRIDGTESSIENSTSSVYGIHTKMAAQTALNTM